MPAGHIQLFGAVCYVALVGQLLADLVTVWLCGQSPTHRPLGSDLYGGTFQEFLQFRTQLIAVFCYRALP